MKRLFVVVMLLFLFTNVTNAEEVNYVSDKLTIKNLDVSIVLLGNNLYRVEESYKTKLIFGDLPDTYYFIKNIPLEGVIYYNNEKVTYTAELSEYEIAANTYYFIDQMNGKNARFKIGDQYSLFKENEEFTIKYDVLYKRNNVKLNDIIYYTIVQSEYDVEELSFNMTLPFSVNKEDISFSTNGKDFNTKVDDLSYEVSDTFDIVGSYKNIKSGDKLVVKVNLEKNKSVENKKLIVYVSVIGGVVSILGIFMFVSKRRSKRL